ncbi:MAG: DNA polymerase III subunit gamma/tau [Flavobacteriales bacterium]|jgi:DNA polymerase-3 subunit gamma/tau|uniref:DNA polymerase III subunit gamma/tau n=1 Tax=Blattabacterium sp. (Mastotermes darwiniensis) TaxID=39768 RepID=UPI000231DF5B|nr:DNA polymerase III subunit gamma/tau [Blattabacterium sp. (Mastotermes darwiniensis)]AER40371.1 DNA polymerase III holoenzyme, tau and gamma [Blattabacterium sp. (Mastotermes darwiniensis) str. MADAR]MDR1804908.1 DNA polymerase III subunit gamma/tau [Flavobacteriales bacterium]
MDKSFYHIVLTRKYRPVKWNEVIGQNEVIIVLKKAIEKNRLSQFLFFFGPKGVGKNTCARILASELNSFSEEESPYVFEISGIFHNSREIICEIIGKIRLHPKKGKYKIFIINDVHFFSQDSFNIFFHMMEKSPSHALFIFCITKKNGILDPIISRSQVYEFKRISLKEIYFHLKEIMEKEGIQIEKEALFLIAQYGNGSMSKAISTFDKLSFWNYEKKKITKEFVMEKLGILDPFYYFKIIDYLLDEKIYKILILLDQIFQKGVDPISFIIGLTKHFRNLFLSKNYETISLLKDEKKTIQSYIHQSKKLSFSFLINALMICRKMEDKYEMSKNFNRLTIELYLIQLANSISSYNPNYFFLKNKKIQYLQEFWKNFIHKFSEKINPVYLNTLKNEIKFQILKNRIIMIIPSQLEIREFFLIQTYFIKHCRIKLKNPHLEFKTIIKQLENYPIKEYNFLSKKNKCVEELIERLNLKFSSSIQ